MASWASGTALSPRAIEPAQHARRSCVGPLFAPPDAAGASPARPPRPPPCAAPGDAGVLLDRHAGCRVPRPRPPARPPGGPRRPGACRTGVPRWGPREARAAQGPAVRLIRRGRASVIPAPGVASAPAHGCPPRARVGPHPARRAWRQSEAAHAGTPRPSHGQTPLGAPLAPGASVCPAPRPRSAAARDRRASAHQTRWRARARTTESVAWPGSGCRPALARTTASPAASAAANGGGSRWRAASIGWERCRERSRAS
jgi:hypothetical protein